MAEKGSVNIDSRTVVVMLLAIIMLSGFVLRLWPHIVDSSTPYGRSDAAFHYQMARMVSEGRDLQECDNCIYRHVFKGGYFYPPLTHHLSGYISRFSGIEIQDVIYPLNSLMSSLLILSVFLLSKRLFGDYPALASAFFIAFGTRELNMNFWGQWPSMYSLWSIPACLLLLMDLEKDSWRLPVFSLFLGFAFLTYPATGLFIIFVSSLYLLSAGMPKVDRRGLFVSAAILLIILLLLLPKIPGWMMQIGEEKERPKFRISELSWYTSYLGGYPSEWKSFKLNYPFGSIVFILAGIIVCLNNIGDNRARLILILVASQYLITHGYFTGLYSAERASRMINQEGLVFSLVIAATFSGMWGERRLKKGLALLLAAVFVFHAVNVVPAATEYYSRDSRPLPEEMKAYEWIVENTQEDDVIILFGGDGAVTIPWGTALTQRKFASMRGENLFFLEYEMEGDDYENAFFMLDLYVPNTGDAGKVQQELVKVDENMRETTQAMFSSDTVIIRKPLE